MNHVNFMKTTEQLPWTLICSKTNKFQSQLDVLFFNSAGNPKYKSLKFNGKTLVSFDHFGNTIAVYENIDNKLNIYTTETTLKSSFDGKLNLNYISVYKDNWLYASSNDGKIHIYDLIKEKIKKSIKTSLENPIIGFDITSNDQNIVFQYDNGLAGILQTKSSKIDLLSWINEPINCLKTNPWKSTDLLVGKSNGIVGLFDIETKRKINNWNYHESGINCLAFSFYNQHLMLSGGKDNQAILYATNSSKPQHIHKTKSSVISCSMSDGILYSFGESNGNLSIFDIRNTRDPVFFHQTSSSSSSSSDFNNNLNYLQFKFDSFTRNNSSENNFESTIIDYTDEENNNTNCLDSSLASCFSEPSDQSINSSKFKLPNEIIDSFNISRFSQFKQQQQNQFSLSPIIDYSNNSSNETGKPRKQVQFINEISKSSSPPPVEKDYSNISHQSNIDNNNNNQSITDRFDNEILRQIIKEEIEKVLIPMEERLKTQLLVEIIDQLAITERTIIDSLKPVIKQSEELLIENEYLRK